MKNVLLVVVVFIIVAFVGVLYSQEQFQSPPEVRSINGVLNLDLRVTLDSVEVAGKKLFTRAYNNLPTGPTFRVKAGDLLRIKVKNEMPLDPDETTQPTNHNFPNKINRTNLHTHGLFVSSKDSADNPFIDIYPQTNYQYHIEIPESHQDGTNWYHPHRHGSIWAQMAGGLAGAIIVEGETDEVPEIKAAVEQVMVIQQFTYDSVYSFPYPNPDADGIGSIFPGADSAIFTLNGRGLTKITIRPGEIQRWRIINAHLESFVYITTMKGEENIPLWRFAVDGMNLKQPGYKDSVLLAAGNRSDMLFKAPLETGLCTLRIVEVQPFSKEITNHDMVIIDVTGEINDMPMPAGVPFPERLKFIEDDEITNTRTMTFSSQRKDNPYNIFFIDDKVFDEMHSDIVVRVDDVEEWTLVNTTTEVHPFHIHINDFLVTEINGEKQEPPVWWDVMNIPPQGSLKFRTRFEKFDGKTVLHCHNIVHEDLGMMQVVEILPKSSSVDDKYRIDVKALYPNPVVGNMQDINFDLPEFLKDKMINVEIFDVQGKKLFEQLYSGQLYNHIKVDVSSYPKGSYFFKVTSGNYNNSNKFIILK